MGYLTTIQLHNDAIHAFKENPEAFGKKILSLINEANMHGKQATGGIGGYSNYIDAFPSVHADDTSMYLSYGNSMFEVNPYRQNDFGGIIKNRPELAKQIIDRAKAIIKDAESIFKKSFVKKP